MEDSKPPTKKSWTIIDPNPPPGKKKPQGYEGRKPEQGGKHRNGCVVYGKTSEVRRADGER